MRPLLELDHFPRKNAGGAWRAWKGGAACTDCHRFFVFLARSSRSPLLPVAGPGFWLGEGGVGVGVVGERRSAVPDLVAFVFEPAAAQPVATFEVTDSAFGAGAPLTLAREVADPV